MSNDFLTNLFRKIIAVLCVVCKGLHNNLAQFYNKLNFDTTKAHKIMSTQQYKLLSTADLPDEQIVLWAAPWFLFSTLILSALLPYTQEVFISTNFRHFR